MKILLVHNRYLHRGGEDTVFEAEAALLEERGFHVSRYIADNAEIAGMGGKARALLAAAGHSAQARRALEVAREVRADIVHIHNFFPLLGPGVHRALAAAGFPVVQTLHNYRLLCANGMFLRDGRACELCLEDSRDNALRYACYRDSRAATAGVLLMQQASIESAAWRQSVARFIALTRFQKGKMVAGGLPPQRIAVKGNSVADPGPADAPREGALFVGRIAPGKGVETLIEAWQGIDGYPLTVIGEGPGLAQARAGAPPWVRFLGGLPRGEVIAHMQRARCLVLPSTWYEGFPMTLVEAFACGLPVIASRLGALSELIEEGRTGWLFEPGNALDLRATALRALAGSGAEAMGAAARQVYLAEHSPDANFERLRSIYDEARSCLADRSARMT